MTESLIYLGGEIRTASERLFLAALLARLDELGLEAVILANFHLGGRQIDFVVATDYSVEVVEVKSSCFPIRGDLNGSWYRASVSGEWIGYRNGYEQALDSKNRFRDAMASLFGSGQPYPAGHLVFIGEIPEGSSLTSGDFKVAVAELQSFLARLPTISEAPWPRSACQKLAQRLNLELVTPDTACSPPELAPLHAIVQDYRRAFLGEYGSRGTRWLAEDVDQEQRLLAVLNGGGCYIEGPSGCGKTLMAIAAASEWTRRGHPVLFLPAKDFADSWSDLIAKEIAYLVDYEIGLVRRAFSAVGRELIIVVDGLNEFGARYAVALRGVNALARRLNAKLLLTSQEAKPSTFAGLATVVASPPSIELKRKIVAANGDQLSPALAKALEAVSTGLEAEIVGRVGATLAAKATRVQLLERYARNRLGARSRSASFALRRLASRLVDEVTFSMDEVAFDELMVAMGVSFADCDAMLASGVLVERGGRVSFSHEMFRNAFAAFDLARTAMETPTALAAQLDAPLLKSLACDIVSAIEDANACHAVLAATTNISLLAAAAEGELGALAATAANQLLDAAAEACVEELRTTKLRLDSSSAMGVEWSDDVRRRWSEPEKGRLAALGHCAVSSRFSSYMRLCSEMDAALDRERCRLADEARKSRIALRSRSFAVAYYHFGSPIGFSFVTRTARPFSKRRSVQRLEAIDLNNATSGQLHFILENRYDLFHESQDELLAELIIFALTDRFRWEPYHVRLELLSAAGFVRRTSDATVARLIAAIQALQVDPADWAINSSIIDALKLLGALDGEGEENRSQIKDEIAWALNNDNAADLALSLCVRMFDHPFDSIYAEEIYNLEPFLLRTLYRRAIASADVRTSMSLAWLARQVVEFDDPVDGPLLRPLAALPDRQNVFPQEQWGAFVLATRFLGRHGFALPYCDDVSDAAQCMLAIRTILYAASRPPSDRRAADDAWLKLGDLPVGLTIGCLAEFEEALCDRHWGEQKQAYEQVTIADLYPSECLALARRFLAEDADAQYFLFPPVRETGPAFVFSVIGRLGDRSDLTLLKSLTRGHRFAADAVQAIQQLDGANR